MSGEDMNGRMLRLPLWVFVLICCIPIICLVVGLTVTDDWRVNW